MIVRLVTLTVIGATCAVLLWDWSQREPARTADVDGPRLQPGEIEVTVLAPPRETVPPDPAATQTPESAQDPGLATPDVTAPILFELAGAEDEPRPLDTLVDVIPTSTPVDPVGSSVSAASPVPPMMLFVTGDRVNLRAKPSINSRVLTRLKRGDAVVLMGDPGGGWLEIRAIRGGTQGFMSIDFLSPEDPR